MEEKMKHPRITLIMVSFIVTGLIFTLCAGTAFSAESARYNWKMTSFFPTGMALNRPIVEFARTVEQRSNGIIKITLYEGTLGAPGDHWDMLKNNAIQIAYTGEANNPGRLPVLGLTNLPYEFSNIASQGMVADEWLKAGFLRELTDNFKVIGFLPLTLQNMFLSKKKVTTLPDLKGLKIRSASAAQGKVVSALGGTGISMPGGETYMALQTGVVDGTVTGVDYFVDNKFYEVCRYALQDPIYGGVFILIMNKETWAGLPKDLQTMVEQISREVAAKSTKILTDEADQRWKIVRDKKVEVYSLSSAEQTQWQKTTAGVADSYVQEWASKGYPVKEALALMRKVVAANKK
jgi:TRAP-type C4-dicarboxylate transport system substrate-binding protein